MKWLARLGFVATGLAMILLAKTQLKAGHAVFANASYHQTTFAAGGFGIGVVFLLLACLPPSDWVYRHITTRAEKWPRPGHKFLKRRKRRAGRLPS